MGRENERDADAREARTRGRHGTATAERAANLRRTLAAAGYMLSGTASGAVLLEDSTGAAVATVRILRV